MKLLEVKNLYVVLDGQKILENVNFCLEEGEFLGVIGPNGAGKTTLLKAILGLVPYEGEVKIFGESVKKHLDKISYVPQRFEFDKSIPITVEEFLNLTHYKLGHKEKEHILKETGVFSYIKKKLSEISGGQLQRVLITKALIDKPKLLLMDEPITGIDIEGEKKFVEILKHLNQEHKISVILVSHELSIIYNLAQKILCLNKKMFCFGDVKSSLTIETLKAVYGEEYQYRPHTHE